MATRPRASLRSVAKISNALRLRLKSLKAELADATLPGRTKYEYLTWQLNADVWGVLQVAMSPSFSVGSLELSVYLGVRSHSLSELSSQYLNLPYSRTFAHIFCGLHQLSPTWAHQTQVTASDYQKVIDNLAHQVLSIGVPALTEVASLRQISLALQGNLQPWQGRRSFFLPLVHVLLGDWTSAIAAAKQENDEAQFATVSFSYREAYAKFFARLVSEWQSRQGHQ